MTAGAIHSSDYMAATGFVCGQAAPVQSLNTLVAEIAKTDIPVLLVGESGTGKEVYARLIHRLSGLGGGILKKLNCASLNAGRLLAEVEKEIEAGRFRRELYFRINGVILRLPPLRERKEDIPALLESFFVKHSNELKRNIPELSSDAHELLGSYDWPGNIRELENVAKKIVSVGDPALALADVLS